METIFFLFLRGGQVFIFIIAQSVGVYEGGGCVRVFKMENGTDVAVSFLSFSPFWARPGAITPTRVVFCFSWKQGEINILFLKQGEK